MQVLGMLEAAGLRFDYLWVMGLHDGRWPASPRPNPFIPLPLQRAAGLPHSSQERELQVARTLTDRILAGADQVVVSFPERRDDEELRLSPLIDGFSPADPEALRLWPASTWRDIVHDSARLIPLPEDPAPPLGNAAVSGGSAILKYQAACPFRAFAQLRLGARALGQAVTGLSAIARGSLIHQVLEKVWRVLGTRRRLVAMDTAGLEALIGPLVDEVIAGIAPGIPRRSPAASGR